jgi:hypothetical protein
MKNTLTLSLLFAFYSIAGNAQNLVPNPSFESGGCPQGPGEIVLATSWTQPSFGTTDYFNVCGATAPLSVSVPSNLLGWQNARTGIAYAGFCAIEPPANYSYREYMQTQLSSPLQAGTKYFVRFYVALADCVSYATDDIGVDFSANAISAMHDSTLNVIPQVSNPEGNVITDKVYWTLIEGSFVAAGGEQYMTIGNFKNNQNTDVQFVSWNFWSTAYYYVDDICVSDDSLECELATVQEYAFSSRLKLYPNPVSSDLNVECEFENSESVIMNIYSVQGQRVLTFTETNVQRGTQLKTISVAELPEGIYILEILQDGAVMKKKFAVQR